MDGLLIRLINAGQQHQNLRLLTFKVVARLSFEGAAVVNGMNNVQYNGEEGPLITFERQQPVPTNELTPIVGFERRVEHLGLELNDLIAPAAVRNTELQRLHPGIWCD